MPSGLGQELLLTIEGLLAHGVEVVHLASSSGEPPIGFIDIDLTVRELLQHLKA